MLIFAAIVAIFVYGMIAAMLGTILPELSERFKLTPTQNGAIAFSQAMGLTIASVGVGPLLDSQGDKIGILLGLALIVIGLFLLPRASGYGSILSNGGPSTVTFTHLAINLSRSERQGLCGPPLQRVAPLPSQLPPRPGC